MKHCEACFSVLSREVHLQNIFFVDQGKVVNDVTKMKVLCMGQIDLPKRNELELGPTVAHFGSKTKLVFPHALLVGRRERAQLYLRRDCRGHEVVIFLSVYENSDLVQKIAL